MFVIKVYKRKKEEMITKNKENKNGFQIYQDLLVDILENLDKLVGDFYQGFFTPLLKQMKGLDTLLTFRDYILNVQKEKIKDSYFIGKLIDKTETRYISHNGSPDSKIFALLRDTITDFNEEDLDDTISFDVKEKKLVLYNFIEYSSPYKNGFSLTDYPFTPGKSFSKDLKKKMEDGEENPYTSLSVLVVKHYAGIISAEEVKQELKKKITDIIKWATLTHSTSHSSIEISDSIHYLPTFLSVQNIKRINILEMYHLKFVVPNKTDLYLERVYFTHLNDLFHFTKEEVESVFGEELLKEKPFFLNCLE
jgi:hypothetical protein